MKRVIFIFSSPLQFFFSCIVANSLNRKCKIEGYYYNYSKDFTSTYKAIKKYIASPLDSIKPLDEFNCKDLQPVDEIFMSNRYNVTEVKLYTDSIKKTKNIFLYEEGFNMYIKHHFNNVKLNDYNLLLSFKNLIKKNLNIPPSHIKLSKFKKIYSSFPIEHLKDQSKWNKIIFGSDLNSKSIRKENDKQCLFLSQSLVEDGFVSMEVFLEFMSIIIKELDKNYQTIYFKPHPRDDDKLISKIFDSNNKIRLLPSDFQILPAEIFLMKHDIDVYGFSSSTLLYGSAILETNTWQCLEELLKYNHNSKLESFYNSVSPLFESYKINKFILTNKI